MQTIPVSFDVRIHLTEMRICAFGMVSKAHQVSDIVDEQKCESTATIMLQNIVISMISTNVKDLHYVKINEKRSASERT
jgi:hypothetical protein